MHRPTIEPKSKTYRPLLCENAIGFLWELQQKKYRGHDPGDMNCYILGIGLLGGGGGVKQLEIEFDYISMPLILYFKIVFRMSLRPKHAHVAVNVMLSLFDV